MKTNFSVISKNLFKTLAGLAFFTLMATGIQAQDTTVVQPEHESTWEKAGEEIKEAAGAVGEASMESLDKAKDESASAWDKTKKGSAELWDKTKEESEEVWDKTKEGSKKAWDKAKETTTEGYDAAKQKVHEMTAPEQADVPKEPLVPPVPAE